MVALSRALKSLLKSAQKSYVALSLMAVLHFINKAGFCSFCAVQDANVLCYHSLA